MAMHERPLLSLMRDIHTPDGVDWWPLAPGGWLLLLLGSTLLVFSLLRQYRGNRLQHEARSELKRIRQEFQDHRQQSQLSMEINILLRRVALTRAPRSLVAGLVGKNWLKFLDQRGGDGEFSHGPGQVLGVAPYAPGAEVDAEALLRLAEQWIRRGR
ncbi:MAG: DUF4381 domain-containing protein [Gammaproteobacteria bacterium]|nr:DUF4381 domain-containing protein [Gammaproteobacteria bacterium]